MKKLRTRTSATLALALLAGSGCFAQEPLLSDTKKNGHSDVGAEPSGSTKAEAVRPPVNPKVYTIGEADLLHITVYKEAELSQTTVVRPDGMITVAFLNDVKVSGKTPLQVQEELTESLKPYLVNPQVTVTVVDVRSKSVYVTGAVQRPDAYPLLAPVTVLQILAKAGGTTIYANRKGIFVLRNQEKIPFPYNDLMKGKKSAKDIQLQPGDTVVVP